MDVVGDLQTKGLRILVRSLATPYVTDPLLDTIGLGAVWLMDFRKPIKFWGIASCGVHVFVGVVL